MKPAIAFIFIAAIPIAACTKSQDTMCAEAAEHTVRLGVMENAPLNSSKEMIEKKSEQLLNHPVMQQTIRECLDRKITKQQYECVMKSKTVLGTDACGM